VTYCLRRLTPDCNCFACYARKTAENRNAGLQAMHDLVVWTLCQGFTDGDQMLCWFEELALFNKLRTHQAITLVDHS
jgi:hypothetical protein